MSKGHRQRKVDKAKFDSSFDRIFGGASDTEAEIRKEQERIKAVEKRWKDRCDREEGKE
jgi:hypothetical protein|tara:strand:+ start:398 stop:574 length:177 start_codon:yes stop_codon:yes gene_type:complete